MYDALPNLSSSPAHSSALSLSPPNNRSIGAATRSTPRPEVTIRTAIRITETQTTPKQILASFDFVDKNGHNFTATVDITKFSPQLLKADAQLIAQLTGHVEKAMKASATLWQKCLDLNQNSSSVSPQFRNYIQGDHLDLSQGFSYQDGKPPVLRGFVVNNSAFSHTGSITAKFTTTQPMKVASFDITRGGSPIKSAGYSGPAVHIAPAPLGHSAPSHSQTSPQAQSGSPGVQSHAFANQLYDMVEGPFSQDPTQEGPYASPQTQQQQQQLQLQLQQQQQQQTTAAVTPPPTTTAPASPPTAKMFDSAAFTHLFKPQGQYTSQTQQTSLDATTAKTRAQTQLHAFTSLQSTKKNTWTPVPARNGERNTECWVRAATTDEAPPTKQKYGSPSPQPTHFAIIKSGEHYFAAQRISSGIGMNARSIPPEWNIFPITQQQFETYAPE